MHPYLRESFSFSTSEDLPIFLRSLKSGQTDHLGINGLNSERVYMDPISTHCKSRPSLISYLGKTLIDQNESNIYIL